MRSPLNSISLDGATTVPTAASFNDIATAELAQSVLEAEGIPSSIPNAQLIGLDWRLSGAVGGIHVDVASEHLSRAREVLFSRSELGVASNEGAVFLPEPAPEPLCPACGARAALPDKNGRRLLALSLLFAPLIVFAIPAYFYSRGRLRCTACRSSWRPGPESAA